LPEIFKSFREIGKEIEACGFIFADLDSFSVNEVIDPVRFDTDLLGM